MPVEQVAIVLPSTYRMRFSEVLSSKSPDWIMVRLAFECLPRFVKVYVMAHPAEEHVRIPDSFVDGSKLKSELAFDVVSVDVVVTIASLGAGPDVMYKVNVAARYTFSEPHLVSTALPAFATTSKVPSDAMYLVTSIFWQFDDFDHSHVLGSHSWTICCCGPACRYVSSPLESRSPCCSRLRYTFLPEVGIPLNV